MLDEEADAAPEGVAEDGPAPPVSPLAGAGPDGAPGAVPDAGSAAVPVSPADDVGFRVPADADDLLEAAGPPPVSRGKALGMMALPWCSWPWG